MFFKNKREVGKIGEDCAKNYLKKLGWKILDTNYHYSRLAELDIVAKDGDTIVFVEVKTRSSKEFGGGIAAVNAHKRRNIIITSEIYMKETGFDGARRYDVAEVYIDENKKVSEINYIENGFPWEGRLNGKHW